MLICQEKAPPLFGSGGVGQTWRLVKTNLQAKQIVSQAKIAKCDGHHVLSTSCFCHSNFSPKLSPRRSLKPLSATALPGFLHWPQAVAGITPLSASSRNRTGSGSPFMASRKFPRGARSIVYYNPTSGPNLTIRFAQGFPAGLACASLRNARANEHSIECDRPQRA